VVAYRYYDLIGVLTILTGLALIISQYMTRLASSYLSVQFLIGILILILGVLLLLLNSRERRKEAEEKRVVESPVEPESPTPTQPPRPSTPPSPRKPR